MLKKIRFYWALIRAFLRRDKKKITFGFIILLFVLFLLKVLIPAVTPKVIDAYTQLRKPTFVEGAVGIPEHPNPLFDSTETQKDISKLIFRGLLKVNSKGELLPDLAESYEKKGEKEYVFHLKTN